MEEKKANELALTRILHAPIKLVWEAWTDPEQVAKWWGPRGFSLTTHSKELKAGGHWDYTMHGPDGTDYPNLTKYYVVDEYSKLVYDHGGSHDSAPIFRVTVNFYEISDNKTRMEMTMAFPSEKEAIQTEGFIKAVGGNSTWDRLSEYLEKNSSGKEVFVINRSFKAPIDVMFNMWTDVNHFSKWIAPKGLIGHFIKADISEGSKTLFMMTDGGNFKMYGSAHYLKIEKPHTIIYTQQFCDEHGNISRHPLAPVWPETMLTKVDLIEEGPNQTRVTLTWETYGDVSQEELACFVKEKAGMTVGWTGSFDKLDELL